MARALPGGQTYCELAAQQASIRSHRSGLLPRAAVDKSTEGHLRHVSSESPSNSPGWLPSKPSGS